MGSPETNTHSGRGWTAADIAGQSSHHLAPVAIRADDATYCGAAALVQADGVTALDVDTAARSGRTADGHRGALSLALRSAAKPDGTNQASDLDSVHRPAALQNA